MSSADSIRRNFERRKCGISDETARHCRDRGGGIVGVQRFMNGDSTVITYEDVKALAARLGRPASTLVALAPANDPFYIAPARQALAHWFKNNVWDVLTPGHGVHLRRLHYAIVNLPSERRPQKLNGLPYENTDEDWLEFSSASVAARELGLADAGLFVDRRAGEPVVVHIPEDADADADLEIVGGETERPAPESVAAYSYVPRRYAFPTAFPSIHVEPPGVAEPYAIEIWAEKSTMNDILVPLAREHDVTLITGLGELSLTHCHQVVERVLRHRRRTRILYISDFDPAGCGMPVSVARKIEHIVRRDGHDLDIRLDPLVLTHEQVERYRLPRIPIKDTDRRKDGFEGRYGTGATELDALEAIHPGELRRIVEQAIAIYREPGEAMRAEAEEVADDAQQDASEARREVLNERSGDIDGLRAVFDEMTAAISPHQTALTALAAEFEARCAEHIDAINERTGAFYDQADELWAEIASDMEDCAPDLADYDWPTACEADEPDDPLFDSTRDYVTQIDRYKAHQGKPTERRPRRKAA
jgi:hypothetical protein